MTAEMSIARAESNKPCSISNSRASSLTMLSTPWLAQHNSLDAKAATPSIGARHRTEPQWKPAVPGSPRLDTRSSAPMLGNLVSLGGAVLVWIKFGLVPARWLKVAGALRKSRPDKYPTEPVR